MTTATPSQKAAYEVVLGILGCGRELFFGTSEAFLPRSRSPLISDDDRLLQPGFVGHRYKPGGLLVVGINPGNGSSTARSQSDSVMMPLLGMLKTKPTLENFVEGIRAQQEAFPSWIASVDLSPMLVELGIGTDEMAYFNALPYRVDGNSAQAAFPTVKRKIDAANIWVRPMVQALQPGVILAHGKKAAEVLDIALTGWNLPLPLVFDRERIVARRNAKNAGLKDRLAKELGIKSEA